MTLDALCFTCLAEWRVEQCVEGLVRPTCASTRHRSHPKAAVNVHGILSILHLTEWSGMLDWNFKKLMPMNTDRNREGLKRPCPPKILKKSFWFRIIVSIFSYTPQDLLFYILPQKKISSSSFAPSYVKLERYGLRSWDHVMDLKILNACEAHPDLSSSLFSIIGG